MVGFFEASEVIERRRIPRILPQCGACGLHQECRSPKMPVTGKGRRGILVVAEAPGAEEDAQGVQLVGETGQMLRATLRKLDVDLDRDCWKTNALICRPPGNRTPTDKEILHCQPNLWNTVNDLQPRLILLLGGPACKSLLGPISPPGASMTTWAGWRIPLQRWNAWVCPTYHPSYINRTDNLLPVARVHWEQHLRAALDLEGRPWATVPAYADQVRLIYDPAEAARAVRAMLDLPGPIALDYETDRLKPDAEGSRIVCVGLCRRGEETIAFPFTGEAVAAVRDLVASDAQKIGANTKFEDRWTARVFGHAVRGWVWDCMQQAHVLDNREGITSVKFQAFVRLGQEPWNDAVERFLDAATPNTPNRISQVDLRTLLTYCGMDALLEYLIAVDQRREYRQMRETFF